MTKESLKYVVYVLKGKLPDKYMTHDWYEIIGLLYSHRTAGLFYSRAKKINLQMPYKAEKLLSEIFLKQTRKNAFMRGQLSEISEAMIERRIACIFPKGSFLSNMKDEEAIYTEGERISNDIDIIVNPNGITAVSEVLTELGYKQGRYDARKGEIVPFTRLEILTRRMNRGETAPYVKLTGNPEFPFIEADINFSLGNVPEAYSELLSDMVASGMVYEGKIPLLVSDIEMFFLHLILHQYKESALYFMVERSKDLELYKLADIYYLWNSGLVSRKRFRKIIEKYNLNNEVAAVFGQVERVFLTEVFYGFIREGDVAVTSLGLPQVIDYSSKKTYYWKELEPERICSFDSRNFFQDIDVSESKKNNDEWKKNDKRFATIYDK